MANDLTGPIWVLDTIGAVTTDEVRVERIAWKNGTTAGHTAKVTDAAGGMVFEDFAAGATYVVSEPIYRALTGLTVEALDSGKLYVTLAHRPYSF